jgi:hypothetical protein
MGTPDTSIIQQMKELWGMILSCDLVEGRYLKISDSRRSRRGQVAAHGRAASRSIMLMAMLAGTMLPPAWSQEQTEPEGTGSSAPKEEQNHSEEAKLPEAEFVGSTSFRSASLIQPIWRDLSIDTHYFGGNENNVGFAGGSWTFHGKSWKLAPGFGVSFGDNGFRTMPSLTIRWGYEHNWFVSEGLLVQGLLHTPLLPEGTEPEPGHSGNQSVIPFIADGDHVSGRWKRLTVGGTWEHMQFREGKEWKGGVRVAYRVVSNLSLTFFAMGPGSEIRGGILFQPEKEK